MVTLQGKSCGPYLSASVVRFSRRGAIQMFGPYLSPLPLCIVCTAEPAHATSAESPGAVGRRSNGSMADGPSSPGASGREARSPSSGSATAATTTTNSGDSGAAQGQLNKLKRFLATVQQFADDIAPDIGDRVRTLVLALVVSICMHQANTLSTKYNSNTLTFDIIIALRTLQLLKQLI